MKKTCLTCLLFLGILTGVAAAQSWSSYGPTPRYGHSAVFDSSSKQMIVFGGFSASGGQTLDADTWRLLPSASRSGLQNWVAVHPAGTPPPGRGGHFAGYAPTSNRMVIFGGQAAGGCVNDAWVLTNVNGHGGQTGWSQLAAQGTPPPARKNFGGAYDPVSNTLMVQDGYDCSTSTPIDDYWILSNANGLGGTPTWVEVNTGSNRPGPRFGHNAAYDPTTNELIIFGGTNGQRFGNYEDLWVLSNANGIGGPAAWKQISTLGKPPAGEYWPFIYDPVSNVMTLYAGGFIYYLSYANGVGGIPTWTYSGGNSPIKPGGDSQGTIVYDASRDAIILFGGSLKDVNVYLFSPAGGQ